MLVVVANHMSVPCQQRRRRRRSANNQCNTDLYAAGFVKAGDMTDRASDRAPTGPLTAQAPNGRHNQGTNDPLSITPCTTAVLHDVAPTAIACLVIFIY